MALTRPIRALPQDVIDKIAAGEVIQRPKNVVKELIENCLDAGSTAINVFVRYAGSDIHLIQVRDNGHGISKGDLHLACQRFSTSKLQSFDDLSSIQTFGFRGEALASMSHVARVTIVSRTEAEEVGYEVKYLDGAATSRPKPIAASKGTTITVEDLFYNVPIRKSALRNLSEEYRMIVELVSLYSLDNLNVSFSLKKHNADPDVRTKAGSGLSENIRDLFGLKLSKNLVPITYEDNQLKVSAHGMVSDLNAAQKAYTFILFINKRLVECAPLKKSIESIYRNHLAKGNCSFVFLSMKIEPEHMDVNIHPTKNEVRFLFEDEVTVELAKSIEDKLSLQRTSHIDLNTSLKMSNNSPARQIQTTLDGGPQSSLTAAKPPAPAATPKRPATMVRNSHESQKINVMFERQAIAQNIGQNNIRRIVKLNSVLSLRNEITKECAPDLRKVVAESTYVGVSKDSSLLMFIQHSTNLFCVDLKQVLPELFYQVYLLEFSNFGYIKFTEPLSLYELSHMYLQKKNPSGNNEAGANLIVNMLKSKQMMIDDYFAIKIEDKQLHALPILLDGYEPDLYKLPYFIADLAHKVDWSEEKSCFYSVGRSLAQFYTPDAPTVVVEKLKFAKVVECVLYPFIKKHFRPCKTLQSAFKVVGSVPDFYKVFHRC